MANVQQGPKALSFGVGAESRALFRQVYVAPAVNVAGVHAAAVA